MTFALLPIRLRPPRPWNPVTNLVLLGALAAGVGVARGLGDGEWVDAAWQAWLSGAAVAVLLGAAGLLTCAALRPREPREIGFGESSVRLPAGQYSPRMLDVGYGQIFGVERMGRSSSPRVVVGVRGRISIAYPERAFERPGDGERLLAELGRRIALQPGGDAQLRAMEGRHRVQRRSFDGPWPFTLGVLTLLLAVFLVELAVGATGNAAELARLGGQVPELVLGGQWWRLSTASLLHADLLHVYMNGLALLALGFLLERLFGPMRFAWLLLAGALGSGLASVAAGDHLVSVGASGAIFALIAAWLVLNIRHREALPPALYLPGWYIVSMAILEIGSEAMIPNVDTAAHAGGFAAGCAATVLALPHRSLERSLARHPKLLAQATALLGVVFAVSLGMGAWSVLFGGETNAARFAVVLLEKERPPTLENDQLSNELAWVLATSEDPTPEGLSLAIERMREVVERNPDEPHMLDTLATLEYRTGNPREAVVLERRALAQVRIEAAHIYAAQLARFHAAQLAAGEVLVGEGWDRPIPRLDWVATMEGEAGERVLELDLGGPLPHAAQIEAIVVDGEELRALLRIELAPQTLSSVRLQAADDTFERLPEGARVRPALVEWVEWVDANGSPIAAGNWSWASFPYVRSVAELPGAL